MTHFYGQPQAGLLESQHQPELTSCRYSRQLQFELTENGARGRTRTDMSFRTVDFESTAYTDFATRAGGIAILI